MPSSSKGSSRLRHQYHRVRSRFLAAALARLVPVHRRGDLSRFGTDYGGYVVPTALLGSTSICYSGGVGEDTSFDEALIARFGAEVVGLDPTPRAIAHGRALAERQPRYRFEPVGLWSGDTEVDFFAPADPAHVSHSITNLQRTTERLRVPVRTLRSVMHSIGHDHVDLLKVDIEGAEHEVLRAMLEDGLHPRVLCVEFDQPSPVSDVVRTVRRLRRAGYDVVNIERWCYTFVLRDRAA